jgi:hemolysin D
LPAALSLQGAPVSPAGRWVAKILIAMLLALLVWSIFGRMDIIVNASGKVIPTGRTKTIAAVETSRVSGLFVQEGQLVHAGDLLIELDTRMSDREHDKAHGDWELAVLQADRARALIEAVDANRAPRRLLPLEGLTPLRLQDAQHHLDNQWQEYKAKLQRLDGEIQRYSEALPLAAQRAADYAVLAKSKDVSTHAWLEKEQARVDLQGQLSDQRNQRLLVKAETRRTAADALNEANRTAGGAEQDAKRATTRSEMQRLLAPVDGTVQQLTAFTIGGVVPAAQPIMQIVPQQAKVEVEAFIENKDIGFVRESQVASVKIETFDYTKYGTVPAKVTHVSRDAIADPGADSGRQSANGKTTGEAANRGPVYSVKVALDKHQIDVDGKSVALTAGMSVGVEIKVGSRRIIEYFLSPLMKLKRESMNER